MALIIYQQRPREEILITAQGIMPYLFSHKWHLHFLGAHLAPPGSIALMDTAVPTHQMITTPTSIGLGNKTSQALLATSTGPITVVLAASLGSLPFYFQQLILQSPAKIQKRSTSRFKICTGCLDRAWGVNTVKPFSSIKATNSGPQLDPIKSC